MNPISIINKSGYTFTDNSEWNDIFCQGEGRQNKWQVFQGSDLVWETDFQTLDKVIPGLGTHQQLNAVSASNFAAFLNANGSHPVTANDVLQLKLITKNCEGVEGTTASVIIYPNSGSSSNTSTTDTNTTTALANSTSTDIDAIYTCGTCHMAAAIENVVIDGVNVPLQYSIYAYDADNLDSPQGIDALGAEVNAWLRANGYTGQYVAVDQMKPCECIEFYFKNLSTQDVVVNGCGVESTLACVVQVTQDCKVCFKALKVECIKLGTTTIDLPQPFYSSALSTDHAQSYAALVADLNTAFADAGIAGIWSLGTYDAEACCLPFYVNGYCSNEIVTFEGCGETATLVCEAIQPNEKGPGTTCMACVTASKIETVVIDGTEIIFTQDEYVAAVSSDHKASYDSLVAEIQAYMAENGIGGTIKNNGLSTDACCINFEIENFTGDSISFTGCGETFDFVCQVPTVCTIIVDKLVQAARINCCAVDLQYDVYSALAATDDTQSFTALIAELNAHMLAEGIAGIWSLGAFDETTGKQTFTINNFGGIQASLVQCGGDTIDAVCNNPLPAVPKYECTATLLNNGVIDAATVKGKDVVLSQEYYEKKDDPTDPQSLESFVTEYNAYLVSVGLDGAIALGDYDDTTFSQEFIITDICTDDLTFNGCHSEITVVCTVVVDPDDMPAIICTADINAAIKGKIVLNGVSINLSQTAYVDTVPTTDPTSFDSFVTEVNAEIAAAGLDGMLSIGPIGGSPSSGTIFTLEDHTWTGDFSIESADDEVIAFTCEEKSPEPEEPEEKTVTLKTADGTPIENGAVLVNGVEVGRTDATGSLIVSVLSADIVSASGEHDDRLNGVSTFDRTLTQQQILASNNISTVEGRIGMDGNADGIISTFDVTGNQAEILATAQYFWKNWVFIEQTSFTGLVIPPGTTNGDEVYAPSPSDYVQESVIAGTDICFIGVKVGDANGDASPILSN